MACGWLAKISPRYKSCPVEFSNMACHTPPPGAFSSNSSLPLAGLPKIKSVSFLSACKVGTGTQPSPASRPARLLPKVAEGNYWVIALDKDYQTVVIGEPGREYLWILARQPRLPDDQYRALVGLAEEKGFPVDELQRNRDLVPDGERDTP